MTDEPPCRDCQAKEWLIQALEDDLARLTVNLNEAKHTVRLLSSIIAEHHNPALAQLVTDILNDRERD